MRDFSTPKLRGSASGCEVGYLSFASHHIKTDPSVMFNMMHAPSSAASGLIGGGIVHHAHPLDKEFRYLSVSYLDDETTRNGSNSRDNVPGTSTPPTSRIVGVGLNRPDRRNALNRDMWAELGELFCRLDPSVCRVVLLHAVGDVFCAGIDVNDKGFLPTTSHYSDPGRTGLAFLTKLRHMQECFTALETCGIPVVAAVHGPCVGAGVDLVCAADVVWATESSYFSVREVALGLAADVGTLQRLPKRSGNQSLVREVCLTGRNFDANEAIQMGLVGRVFSTRDDMMREAVQLCQVIASHSPLAVAGTKRALLHARDHSVDEGLDDNGLFNAFALQSPDIRIAMKLATSRNRNKTALAFPDLLPRAKL